MYEYKINMLSEKMIEFFKYDPKRIQHFMKVHYLSKLICNMENIDDHTKFITECSAIVHDIGIKSAEQKYGKCNGKLQEHEGPKFAKHILENLDFQKEDIERNQILYKDIENRFQSFFGTKVRLSAGKRRGKIIIEYANNDDLERILELMK